MMQPRDYAPPPGDEFDPDDYDQRPPMWFGLTLGALVLLFTFLATAYFHEETPMTNHQSILLVGKHISVGSSTGEEMRFHPVGTYDNALPQTWVNEVNARFGESPVGHVVWYYPPGDIAGHPMPVDEAGLVLLSRMAGAL